ncbi:hypothetical protein [Labilithrix luteola]|nr:hypothetical protein [Labilithrix luteola]
MVAVAVLLAAGSARATPAPTFDLAWSAPEGCTSRERIVDATRARLAQSALDVPSELVVRGVVTKERGGFSVAIELKDVTGKGVGEREVHVEGVSCTGVEEATALVLAMMIAASPRPEPAPSTERLERLPETDGGDGTPAPSQPQEPTPAKAPERARTSRRLSLGIAGTASLGVLPGAGLGLTLRAAYSPGAILWLGLEATFESGGSIRAAERDVGFQFLHASAFAGVRVVRFAAVEVIVAAALRAGVIRVLPDGFAVVESEARAAVVGGPGALVRTRLAPHLFLEAFPGLDAVFVRDSFEIRDGAQVPIHRPEPFATRLSLGLSYELQ